MANLSVSGLDGLMLSLKELAELPESVHDEILSAQADVVAEAQKKKIRAYGIYDGSSPRHVADSIKKGRVKLHKGQRVIYVSPTGSRRRGKTVTRNAEILFINEYGKQKQPARPAVRDANEESAEAATAAGAAVYDRWVQSKNL